MNRICIIEKSYLLRFALIKMMQSVVSGVDIIEFPSFTEFEKELNYSGLKVIFINWKFITKSNGFLLTKLKSRECKIVTLVNEIDNKTMGDYVINYNDEPENIYKMLEVITSGVSGNPDKFSGEKILSKRETDVLRYVALGLTNKEIAERLFLSTHTIITHRKNISVKLGIKTIAGFTLYAVLNKILLPEEVK